MRVHSLFAAAADAGTITVVVGAVATVCTLAGGGIAWAVASWAKGRKTTIGEYQKIADRLQKQVDRLQSQVDEQQRVINRVVILHADCQAESQELYGLLILQNGILKRQSVAMQRAGIPTEDIPDLPPRPNRHRGDEADFLKRTTQHNTDAVKRPAAKRGADDAKGPVG